MKRLKKFSNFNSLQIDQLGLDTNTALSLIQSKDSRLTPDKAIIYNDMYCSFGGIYKEKNSTALDNTLFAVKFYAYSIYNKELDKDMSYLGVIASNIIYKDSDDNIINPKLGQQYVEVHNSSDKDPNMLVNKSKNLVTVRGLSLEYVAGTFYEAADKLGISA